MKGHAATPVLIGFAGLLFMSLVAYLLNNGQLPLLTISSYKIVNFTLTMQLMVLPVSFIALAVMYLYDRERFKMFFHFNFRSPGKKDNWNVYGPVLAVAFTIGNALWMSAGVAAQNGSINSSFYSLLPFVLLFSATNAWSEEIFSRFVIVAGLNGKLKPEIICWISAIIFGVPHFFGTPSGISGVIMSGVLGWLLAKSVIETRGLGWALLIHFLQDIIIFGAGAMILAAKAR